MLIVILEFVQVLYQQVAGTRRISEKTANISQRLMGRGSTLNTAFFAARAFHK